MDVVAAVSGYISKMVTAGESAQVIIHQDEDPASG